MSLCWCWHANKRYTGYANVLINIFGVLAGLIAMHSELLSSNASEPRVLSFSASEEEPYVSFLLQFLFLSFGHRLVLESVILLSVSVYGLWTGDHPPRFGDIFGSLDWWSPSSDVLLPFSVLERRLCTLSMNSLLSNALRSRTFPVIINRIQWLKQSL